MFKMQIQLERKDGTLEWKDIHPSHDPAPYLYETREEAERMLRICYGPPLLDHNRQRVVKVLP